MKRFTWLALSIFLAVALAPVAFAGEEYATEAGSGALKPVEKVAKSLSPMPEGEATKGAKAYSLRSSYETGRKTGDLRSRAEACQVSNREEYYGRYHLELTKRGESRVLCGFEYRGGYGWSKPTVRMRVEHRATVPGRSNVDILVNGSTVVYEWSPNRRDFHTTSWDVTRYLRDGHNEIEIRLSNYAPKQYWFKSVELSASRDCIYRGDGSGGNGGGGNVDDERYRRMYREAQREFDDGVYYARNYDKPRARQHFRNCIQKCDRVETGASNYSLKGDARNLRQRAQYELNNLDYHY